MGQSKGMSRLKLAEQLIRQRTQVTEQTINEFEHVETNKLRTELNEKFHLSELTMKRQVAQTKMYTEQRDNTVKSAEENRAFEAELAAELAEVNAKYSVRRQKLGEKHSATQAKITEAYGEANIAVQSASVTVEDKLRERGVEIREKAAQMRTQLAHERQSAIDKLYESELSPELKAVIDSIPSITDLDGNSPRLSYKST